MAEDKTETFVQRLLGNLFKNLCKANKLDFTFPPQLEEIITSESIGFYGEIMELNKPFINALQPNMESLPVLLYASKDFFTRFFTSVCMKLAEEGELTAFLKVTIFLVNISYMMIKNRCYRVIGVIPRVYYNILKNHLSTKFYIENRYMGVHYRSKQIQNDARMASIIENEIRRVMDDVCGEELPKTNMPRGSYLELTSRIRIKNVKKQPVPSDPDHHMCEYCGIDCIPLLQLFFQPR